MKDKIKKYKGVILVLVLCLVIEFVSVKSYAFFAYEEEGGSGSLTTGQIYVDYDETHALGALTNQTPNASFNNDNYIGFSVEYKNETNKPLYYDLTLGYGDSVANKLRIHDEHLNFKLTEVDSNGTLLNTLVADGNYASISNTIIKEEEVAAGTALTKKYYRLYVRINTDVNICSTNTLTYGCDYYENRAPQWSNVYASIKMMVNADFKQKSLGTKFYDTIKTGAVADTGIDFGKRNYLDTDDTTTQPNGNGKFYMAGTGANANDLARIYYYRGDVSNNNVVFGGICWKVVRTTDTGGIKMIYNGAYSASTKCNNTGTTTRYTTAYFNNTPNSITYKSLAAIGYSYVSRITTKAGVERAPYEWKENAAPNAETPNDTTDDANVVYGHDVNYNNGVYTLVNTNTGIGNNYHYTCNKTTTSATCPKVRYYYYDNTTGANDKHYYIELEGGDKIEDAVNSMVNVAPDSYSNIQQVINSWYNTNIKISYDAYVEDTVWCMERNRQSRSDGWDSSGGLITDLWATGLTRANGNHNAIKLKCDGTLTYGTKSYTDYYPTRDEVIDQLYYADGAGNIGSKAALLTYDEVKLAGMKYYTNTTYTHNYLYTGYWYWLLSPAVFNSAAAYAGYVNATGELVYTWVGNTSGGVRPVVSLKHGTLVYGGTGTVSDPYVVGNRI